jgi:hypothetical protein
MIPAPVELDPILQREGARGDAMKNKSTILILGLAVALSGVGTGCLGDADSDEALGETSSALLVWYPVHVISFDLVGRGLNGRTLGGASLDGRVVVSVSLEGVLLHGERHGRKLRLDSTVFQNLRALGTTPGPRSLVGAELTATLDDGSSLALRVDAVLASPVDGGASYRYAVSYGTETGRVPLCGVDAAGAAITAIPLNGVWNYAAGSADGGQWSADDRAFTFGCTGHVLAKCADLGYAPWLEGRMCTVSATGRRTDCVRTSLQPFHQACTRALRADFCGNGTSYTVDGTPLEPFDGVGIRAAMDDGLFEAEWTPDGARCATGPRLAGAEFEPPCMAALLAAAPDCGDPIRFEDRTTLLMTALPGAAEATE